jgi:hypothetical protein
MKVGDLVTLSAYALTRSDLWKWQKMVWEDKKSLIGLIVKVELNPYRCGYISQNETTLYYVNWMKDGPISRHGNTTYYQKKMGYFLRNDLKFVK